MWLSREDYTTIGDLELIVANNIAPQVDDFVLLQRCLVATFAESRNISIAQLAIGSPPQADEIPIDIQGIALVVFTESHELASKSCGFLWLALFKYIESQTSHVDKKQHL